MLRVSRLGCWVLINSMNEIRKDTIALVKSEMYQLLLCAFSYDQKLRNLGDRLQKESRLFLLEELTALRHLSNGIILHLCNLDDDGSSGSLYGVRKAVARSPGTQEIVVKGNKLLKKYRSELNKLTTKHRNRYIAHRNVEEYPNQFELLDYQVDFKQLIQLAVSALECLSGAKIGFGFHLGSRDRSIDFKTELGLI